MPNQRTFQKHCHAHGAEDFTHGLFAFMKCLVSSSPEQRQANDFLVAQEEFLVSLAHILKGSVGERTRLIHCISSIASNAEPKQMTISALQAVCSHGSVQGSKLTWSHHPSD